MKRSNLIAAMGGYATVAWVLPLATQGRLTELRSWWALALVAVFFSALYSGAEVGIYSLSKLRLRVRTHRQNKNAVELAKWVETPNYALVALLILQNLSSFAFSAAVTGILEGYALGEFTQAVVSTVIITPVVLIFCEIMPKDLFHTYADRWVYRLVPLLRWSFRLITWVPLLPIVRWLSHMSLKLVKRNADESLTGPRHEMMTLFEESTASGAITSGQQDLVQRALRMARTTIRDVMVPWNRVIGVPAGIGREGFYALVRRYDISRVPVLGRTTTDVLGIAEVLEVLGDQPGYDLKKRLRPAMTLISEQSVRSAITLMQKARQSMAVVVDRQNRAVGIVTMKDLIEELVGDLAEW